ncbi:hypothetical protein J1614_007191 [Plenodomus biglobosus]|nr:hypothetical protein J1614_007191 [Plenodomus biglobosus]
MAPTNVHHVSHLPLDRRLGGDPSNPYSNQFDALASAAGAEEPNTESMQDFPNIGENPPMTAASPRAGEVQIEHENEQQAPDQQQAQSQPIQAPPSTYASLLHDAPKDTHANAPGDGGATQTAINKTIARYGPSQMGWSEVLSDNSKYMTKRGSQFQRDDHVQLVPNGNLYLPDGSKVSGNTMMMMPRPEKTPIVAPSNYAKHQQTAGSAAFQRKFETWLNLPSDERGSDAVSNSLFKMGIEHDKSMNNKINKLQYEVKAHQARAEQMFLVEHKHEQELNSLRHALRRAEDQLHRRQTTEQTLRPFHEKLHEQQKEATSSLEQMAGDLRAIKNSIYDHLQPTPELQALTECLDNGLETISVSMDKYKSYVPPLSDIIGQVTRAVDDARTEVMKNYSFMLQKRAESIGNARLGIRMYRIGLIDGTALGRRDTPDTMRYHEMHVMCTQDMNARWSARYKKDINEAKEAAYWSGFATGRVYSTMSPDDSPPMDSGKHINSVGFAFGQHLVDHCQEFRDPLRGHELECLNDVLNETAPDTITYWTIKGATEQRDHSSPPPFTLPLQMVDTPRMETDMKITAHLEQVEKIINERNKLAAKLAAAAAAAAGPSTNQPQQVWPAETKQINKSAAGPSTASPTPTEANNTANADTVNNDAADTANSDAAVDSNGAETDPVNDGSSDTKDETPSESNATPAVTNSADDAPSADDVSADGVSVPTL